MTYSDDFFNWIDSHINDDTKALRLKFSHKGSFGFDVEFAILQIECRRKYAGKLHETLQAFPRFIFPTALSGEQSTSDNLARFHCTLLGKASNVADLTSGLGIDATHFATVNGCEVTAVERTKDLSDALSYNATGLKCDNLTVFNGDCRDFIKQSITQGVRFGTCFIDPARRRADGGRVYALTDCEPDVVEMLTDISRICERLVIKMSPMLDITHTIGELSPKPIQIVALGTPKECKEVIAVVDFNRADKNPCIIEATTLLANGNVSTLAFTFEQEKNALPLTGTMPSEGDYIYEPYPAVMKTGAHRLLSAQFGLHMFHANTRIYHSEKTVDGFPGEIHRILRLFPYASKHIKRFKREYPRISVCTRNFGIGAEALKAKLGVADGGSLRVYGFTDARGERYLAVVE